MAAETRELTERDGLKARKEGSEGGRGFGIERRDASREGGKEKQERTRGQLCLSNLYVSRVGNRKKIRARKKNAM